MKPCVVRTNSPSNVNYTLKSIDILQSDKAKSVFEKGKKNNWSLDKILSELQIPKLQKELILNTGLTNPEDIILELSSNYSFVVDIQTAKKQIKNITNPGEYSDDEIDNLFAEEFSDNENNTFYYSNLTVPGGTNYTENEISTPLITPSIKGHAQFATDKGIGWFRSDDRHFSKKEINPKTQEELDDLFGKGILSEYSEPSGFSEDGTPIFTLNTFGYNDATSTRRILELQSDLFQKGRDKEQLIGINFDLHGAGYKFGSRNQYQILDEKGNNILFKNLETGELYEKPKEWLEEQNKKVQINKSENQFLQLLNKDNNWVTFFVKSIIQDSAKKGYEKVLFPSGNTASKIEGHTTIEEFKKQKQDRIDKLEIKKSKIVTDEDEIRSIEITGDSIDSLNNEINQLKKEIADIESEGLAKLKPIAHFYENTVSNILKKQGYNPTVITDEYGNTWNEIEVNEVRDLGDILFSPAEQEVSDTVSDIRKNYFGKVNQKTDKQILKTISKSESALAPIASKLLELPFADVTLNLKSNSSLFEFALNNGDSVTAAGAFYAGVHSIDIAENTKSNVEALMIHEILHSYTYYELRKDSPAKEELNSIYQHALKYKDSFTDTYGLENLDEFIVAIYTDAKFIRDMQNLPSISNNTSLWQDLLDYFKRLFKVNPEHSSLFDDAFRVSNLILEQSSIAHSEEMAYQQAMEAEFETMLPSISQNPNAELEKQFNLRNEDGSRKRYLDENKAVTTARLLNKSNPNIKFSTMKVMGEKGDKRVYWAIKAEKRLPATVQVTASNGKPSVLFEQLSSKLGDREAALKVWARTQTQDFKNWFKDSKVVDRNGEPRIMYLTTSANDLDGQNMYFTETPNHNPVYISESNLVIQDDKLVINDATKVQSIHGDTPFDKEDFNLYYDPIEADEISYYGKEKAKQISDFRKLVEFKQDQLSLLKNRLVEVQAARRSIDSISNPVDRQKALRQLIALQAQLERRIGYSSKGEGTGLEFELEVLTSNSPINSIKSMADDDFKRLDAIINSNNIYDIKEAAQIVNFYERMYPPSSDRVHPIFTQEEMFNSDGSNKLDKESWEYYQELAQKAASYRERLTNKEKQMLEKIVNNNQAVKNIHNHLDYNSILNSTNGLQDLNWFDMMLMDITTGVFSENGLIPQIMFQLLQNSMNASMIKAEELQKKLDAMQPLVEQRLREKGQNLSFLNIVGVSYDLFKQKDDNGFETGDLVHRYSTKFYSARNAMEKQFKKNIATAKLIEDLSQRNQAIKDIFTWRRAWFRENMTQLELGKLPEITSNPKFAQFSIHFSTDTQANEEHVRYLKSVLGEKGYKEEVAKQVKELEKFLEDRDAYKDIMNESQLEKFDKEFSPFIGNDYFYSDVEINHYKVNIKPSMKYNISIPRAVKGVALAKDENTGKYTIGDNPYKKEDTGFYDNNFKNIEQDSVLYEYYKLLTEINKEIRNGLPAELQEKIQINSISNIEKSLTEILLDSSSVMDSFSTILVKFWQRIKQKLTFKIQNEVSFAKRDPITGKINYKINDSFFSESNQMLHKMTDVERRRFNQMSGLNISNDTVLTRQQLLSNELVKNLFAEYLGVKPSEVGNKLPNEVNVMDFIRGAMKHQLAQQKSFDLPKVMKMYLDTAAKYQGRNKALPMLEILKKHYEKIQAPYTNNIGTPMKQGRGEKTELDGIRKNAIAQMDNWFDRVVLGNLGIKHSGLLNTVKDFIGSDTTKAKRAVNRIQSISEGRFKHFMTKEEKQLKDKIIALANATDDPEEKQEILQHLESLGRDWSMTSIFDGILSFIRFKNLGFNFSSSMTNLMEGEMSNLILASTGDFFTPDDYWKANAIARQSVIKNISADYIPSSDARKLRILMDKFKIIQDSANELQKSSAKSSYSKIGNLVGPFELNRRTEYLIQTPVIIATMMNQKVTSIDGNLTVNAWDAIDTNGNLKPEFRTKQNIMTWEQLNSPQFNAFKTKAEAAINLAHGNYSELRGMMLKSNVLGKAFIMFKSWLPMAIYSRFAIPQDNLLTGQKGYKGRYRSFTTASGALVGSIAGFGTLGLVAGVPLGAVTGMAIASNLGGVTNTEMGFFKDLLYATRMLVVKAIGMPINRVVGKEVIGKSVKVFGKEITLTGDYMDKIGGSFTERDAKNLNANMTELALISQKFMLMLLVKSMLWDEEDEDDEKRKMHNFLMNKLQAVTNSFQSFLSVSLIETFTKGAFLKFAEDVIKTIDAFTDYMYDLDYITTGTNAGESKLYNQIQKTFVPGMFKGTMNLAVDYWQDGGGVISDFNDLATRSLDAFGIGNLMEDQLDESPFDFAFKSQESITEKSIKGYRENLKNKLTKQFVKEGRLTKKQIKKKVQKLVDKQYPLPKKSKKEVK